VPNGAAATDESPARIAGLLWSGPPNRLLRAVGAPLDLYTSRTLIDELANTLARKKFARRIALQDTNIDALIADYLGLAELVVPASGPRISRDRDDDHVITCAIAAQAEIIVSGDRDLLVLGHHGDIRIINAASAAAEIDAQR
jgi:putative PIN family toxin of toxin-antitoxin system